MDKKFIETLKYHLHLLQQLPTKPPYSASKIGLLLTQHITDLASTEGSVWMALDHARWQNILKKLRNLRSCFYPKIQSKSDPWGLAYYCFVQPLSFILQTQCHYFSYLVTYRLIHVANASRVRLFGPTHSVDLVQGSSDFFPMHSPRQCPDILASECMIYVVQHNRTITKVLETWSNWT